MVVRLSDPQSRDVVTKSGATEIANPDLRENEVLVWQLRPKSPSCAMSRRLSCSIQHRRS